MDMTLSRRGDYVMRSAITLARAFASGEQRKIREVVAETAIPATFASQILADLVRAGLASSRAGRDGGYRLIRSPEEISVLEVIEAAEGTLHAERCALGEGPCRWDAVCPLHETWLEMTGALRELLARTSLAEVAGRDAAIEAGTYHFEGDSHRARPAEVAVADRVEVEAPLELADRRLRALRGELGALAVPAFLASAPDRRRVRDPDRVPAVEARLTRAQTAKSPAQPSSRRYRLEVEVLTDIETLRLEGPLTLGPIDPERCAIAVEGSFRAVSTREAVGRSELERRARRALRAFLRSAARAIDSPAAR